VPASTEDGLYLDTSALVKLVVPEAETVSLTAFVERHAVLTSCSLARVEVLRAARPHGAAAVATARALIARLDLVQLDDELLDLAAELDGPLRSIDAIHVAAAMELGEGLAALVTYDRQMTRAAESLGLPVAAPD
jgi:predicted nucleic acid-binding protein